MKRLLPLVLLGLAACSEPTAPRDPPCQHEEDFAWTAAIDPMTGDTVALLGICSYVSP